MKPVTAAALGIGALLAWGEWETWRASHRNTGPGGDGDEVIVVLGFRNPGPRANLVNRWRVRAALRSIEPGRHTTLVFTGGSNSGSTSEARLMADYAREFGYGGTILLEETSRSTWENIAHVLPLLENAGQIKIVSHTTHALKGRLFLARQRPDLARRLTRGADYRFAEWLPLKPVQAAYGRVVLCMDPAANRPGPALRRLVIWRPW